MDEHTMTQTMKMQIFHGNLTDDRPPLPQGLYEQLTQVCQGLAQVLITDQGRTIQVIPLEAGKLRAVERIRQQLGLSVEEVAVFGDGLNDLEMIRHYPNSVAMGNAVAKVKAAAGYVTTSNEADGIARGLTHLMAIDR